MIVVFEQIVLIMKVIFPVPHVYLILIYSLIHERISQETRSWSLTDSAFRFPRAHILMWNHDNAPISPRRLSSSPRSPKAGSLIPTQAVISPTPAYPTSPPAASPRLTQAATSPIAHPSHISPQFLSLSLPYRSTLPFPPTPECHSPRRSLMGAPFITINAISFVSTTISTKISTSQILNLANQINKCCTRDTHPSI
jgi:hypothetical protein